MKFEIVDAVMIGIALFLLAAYFKLQNIIFVYVVILLIATEIVGNFVLKERKPAD